jgi:hypothetical protein
MKNKILQLLILAGMAIPGFALAAVDFGIGASGNGWSIGIGSGSGAGAGAWSNYGLPAGSVFGIIQNILFWLTAIIGIVAIIGFIISGILYLVASGDETQAEKAKKAMTYSIIGVIVGLSGFVVLQAVSYMLSGSGRF